MREAVGHHISLRPLLDRIIPHRARGSQRLFEVPFLKQIHPLGMMGPYPGIIIGLQLEADLNLVEFSLAEALAFCIQLLGSAQQRLYMMTYLMGNYIRHGEVARRLELLLQLIIEAEIDIQLGIPGQ